MYCSLVKITAALDAPNQDAIKSMDARPGTWNSGRTTGFISTPRNSIIPQSVRNGRIKLDPSTIQNNVPHRPTMLAPVSAEIMTSLWDWNQKHQDSESRTQKKFQDILSIDTIFFYSFLSFTFLLLSLPRISYLR